MNSRKLSKINKAAGFLPEGLLCRRPQNFDVRLSVCLCVSPSVRTHFDHFLDPDMCDIALNNSIDRKKE